MVVWGLPFNWDSSINEALDHEVPGSIIVSRMTRVLIPDSSPRANRSHRPIITNTPVLKLYHKIIK